MIKGESSFWVNKNKLTGNKFEWAAEYYAVSFGDSDLDRVRLYIRNQELHHTQKTWENESNEMIKKYGFVKLPVPPPQSRG